MFDANEIDFAPVTLDSEDTTLDHTDHCGCRDCDPDFYFDPAERDAGARDF
jgi:hypothetical protein